MFCVASDRNAVKGGRALLAVGITSANDLVFTADAPDYPGEAARKWVSAEELTAKLVGASAGEGEG